KLFSDVCAAASLEVLVFAVDAFLHTLQQHARGVTRKQFVPGAAPKNLDYVPAGAAKNAFQLPNNAAVAAHWTVEPLEIAIDDEREIIELLARSHRDGAKRLRLVRFAISEKGPDSTIRARDNFPILEVTQETRLVNGVNRAYSHGHRRKLPEIRH